MDCEGSAPEKTSMSVMATSLLGQGPIATFLTSGSIPTVHWHDASDRVGCAPPRTLVRAANAMSMPRDQVGERRGAARRFAHGPYVPVVFEAACQAPRRRLDLAETSKFALRPESLHRQLAGVPQVVL